MSKKTSSHLSTKKKTDGASTNEARLLLKRKNGSSAAKAAAVSIKSKFINGAGLDEIDSLFTAKKQQEHEEKKEQMAAVSAKKKKYRTENKGHTSSSTKRQRQPSSDHPTASMTAAMGDNEWVNDGLGGKFNQEGYTGRVEDGIKIFKAHILNKPGSGSTPDCPFDCKCCFI